MQKILSHPIMLISAVVIIIFIIYTVFAVRQMREYIKIGQGIAASAVAYEQHPADAKIHILVLGDSSAVGVGASKPEESVAGRIGAAHPDADIVNIAVSGAKVGDLAGQLKNPRIQGKRFDVTYLHIGGNDIVRFTSLAKLQLDLPDALDVLLKQSDRVVLLNGGNVGSSHLFPWPVRKLHTIRTQQVRTLWMQITASKAQTAGSKRIFYVDLFRKGQNDPFIANPMRFYAADFFHPSGEGYRDWYDGIVEAEKAIAQ